MMWGSSNVHLPFLSLLFLLEPGDGFSPLRYHRSTTSITTTISSSSGENLPRGNYCVPLPPSFTASAASSSLSSSSSSSAALTKTALCASADQEENKKSVVLPADDSEEEEEEEEIFDVIVVGAGIGGLSCAALCSRYGLRTVCVEAHDVAGGCAHSFTRYSSSSKKKKNNNEKDVLRPFLFDSGPSLVSGLSSKGTNPLRQVLDAVGTADEIEWKTYDGWMVFDESAAGNANSSSGRSGSSSFKLTTGDGTDFVEAIEDAAGPAARREFEHFRNKLLRRGGLSEASAYVPPMALRGGFFGAAAMSLSGYLLKILSIGRNGLLLTGPFSKVMDLYGVKDTFVRRWFDYLSFALSGFDAAHTQAAPVAYMVADLHKSGAVLDYPVGGMGAIVDALITGMERYGGELRLNSRVEKFVLEGANNKDKENQTKKKGGKGAARCRGVVLSDGKVLGARKGVVCNAPLWNMARIARDSLEDKREDDDAVTRAVQKMTERAKDMCMSGSFMHLHLGIPKRGIPDDLECHHSVLDFRNVTAERNMVIISIPTVFDPNLAPEGYHIIHAYTAACDPFDEWETFLQGGEDSGTVGAGPNSRTAALYGRSNEYRALKDEKADVLWNAVERVIPDVRQRAKERGSVVLIGTPLTHRRYNQRYRGTYGPAPAANKDVWDLPGPNTEIQGLLACGDTTFPGIGLPGVAASGTVAANTLSTVRAQKSLMRELKAKGALQ